MIYAKESKADHLPRFYYLVLWKSYSKEKNTWEPASSVQHFQKVVGNFFKDNPDQPTATFLLVEKAQARARFTMKPNCKSNTNGDK